MDLTFIGDKDYLDIHLFEKIDGVGVIIHGDNTVERAGKLRKYLEKKLFIAREVNANKMGLNEFLGKSYQYSKDGNVIREMPNHLYDAIVASSQLKKSVLFIHIDGECKPEVTHYVAELLKVGKLGDYLIPSDCFIVLLDGDGLSVSGNLV